MKVFFACERNNVVSNPLINFVPMNRLQNWIYMMEFKCFGDSISNSIEKKLKLIYLRRRKVTKREL